LDLIRNGNAKAYYHANLISASHKRIPSSNCADGPKSLGTSGQAKGPRPRILAHRRAKDQVRPKSKPPVVRTVSRPSDFLEGIVGQLRQVGAARRQQNVNLSIFRSSAFEVRHFFAFGLLRCDSWKACTSVPAFVLQNAIAFRNAR
jgi:hypothetical protein